MAIWGLETGFAADNGRFRTMQALATLAYDCRRSAQFNEELKHALKIVERGDMSPAQMRGDWAGEIGQTQFMPSSYLTYGVDFDGDADAISYDPRQTRSPRRRISSRGKVGARAPAGMKASPTSRFCSSGIRRAFT